MLDGRALDQQTAALLGLTDRLGNIEIATLHPDTARRLSAQQMRLVSAPPHPDVDSEDRFAPGPVVPIPLRIYTPPGLASPSPAVVYFHGGGFMVGSIDTYDVFCRQFARAARCRVVSVGYRLAPEHRFPAAVDDALAAFRWVVASARTLAIEPTRVAVAGDSAGGNLAAVVARTTRGEAAKPSLQVLIYPATDMTWSFPSHTTFASGYLLTRVGLDGYRAQYLGGADPRHPDVSPLFGDAPIGVPPAIVVTAGFDPLRDEGRAYAHRMEQAGVSVTYQEYAGLVHGFTMMGIVSAARVACDEVFAKVAQALHH